jgi:hypothetical protein
MQVLKTWLLGTYTFYLIMMGNLISQSTFLNETCHAEVKALLCYGSNAVDRVRPLAAPYGDASCAAHCSPAPLVSVAHSSSPPVRACRRFTGP